MKAKQIQEKIDDLNYWDSEVLQVNIEYFGDEVTIIFDEIKLLFNGCSKVNITTDPQDRKMPIRSLTSNQMPYYMQDIEVTDFSTESSTVVYFGGEKLPKPVEKFNLFKCKILMPPLTVEVCCSSINIGKR